MPKRPFKETQGNINDAVKISLNKVAISSINRIKRRLTTKGEDKDGKALIGGGGPGEYSPSYKKFRKKKGRTTKFINLQFTGKMVGNLKPIRTERNGKAIVLGFSNKQEQEKANETSARHGKWLGLTKKESEAVAKVISADIAKAIKRSDNTIRIKA